MESENVPFFSHNSELSELLISVHFVSMKGWNSILDLWPCRYTHGRQCWCAMHCLATINSSSMLQCKYLCTSIRIWSTRVLIKFDSTLWNTPACPSSYHIQIERVLLSSGWSLAIIMYYNEWCELSSGHVRECLLVM